MSDFDQYLARHGEIGLQAIIERLERYEGVRSSAHASLQDRWTALMGGTKDAPPRSSENLAA